MQLTKITPTTADRTAGHGMRRCGVADYDEMVVTTPAVRNALGELISNYLGSTHPGYTEEEVLALYLKRRNLRGGNPAALASAMALRVSA